MSGEKRSQDREDDLREEMVIIVDVEGTTTSISFVKDKLFPYVRENLKQYIEKNWEVEEFKGDLEKLKEQAKKDETDKVEGVVPIAGATPDEEKESLIKNVLWQMDGDRKTGALKQLQGHMWREAFKSGTVKGHVYEDVPKALDEWTKSGRKVYVYSSGSVEAQKLLFGHSEHGDMLKYFSDYFDTEVGAKQEANSYKNILAKIDAAPSSVLFLTDVVKEAQAAKEAGMSASIVIRQGNAPLTDEEKVTFTTIESFMDLSFQTSAKRQKVEITNEKEIKAPETAPISEPMDTSEDAEPIVEKPAEKVEESKKPAETEKIEETETAEKSEASSMETDSKDETEKKTSEATEKAPVAEESKKTEDESKTNEKMEVTKEEVGKTESEVKKETEVAKKEIEVPKEPEVVKKESEVEKKESEAAKSDTESTKKENDTTKTEVSEVKSEPMDEGKNVLPSKSEPIGKITEEKTKASNIVSEPVSAESKTETERKIVESVPEDKPKDKEVAETPSVPEESAKVAVETKSEESKSEEKKVAPAVEKVEPEVAKEKSSAKVEEKVATEEVKQNGDSVPAKTDEVSVEKSESNGDAKEETGKVEEVAAEPPKASTAEEPEKKSEPVVAETAKKEEPEADKAKVDEAASVESTDAKLNGNAQNGDKASSATDEKPHTNGLNGESSTEKTNGNTKDEAAQNGEAESTSDSTAESIKVKKVVDSTIAEGAGEPEVVPPVAVAATS